MKNEAAVALGRKHVEKHPDLHSKDRMTKLSKLAAVKRTKNKKAPAVGKKNPPLDKPVITPSPTAPVARGNMPFSLD